MKIRKWDELPKEMKIDEVLFYYNIIINKNKSLIVKRIFDIVMAVTLLMVLLPIMIIISISIKCESRGPVLFKQVRITQYGRRFKILKFRTMVVNAESIGAQVTSKNDIRVTKIGSILRKLRFDELPQLINILTGDMSFVGTRPEVVQYVEKYTPNMLATLLLPAGVTSYASIYFKDEENILNDVYNIDEVYVKKVLPLKMKYNLEYLSKFKFYYDIIIIFKTIVAVFGRKNKNESISSKQVFQHKNM